MYATKLIADSWSGVHCETEEIASPSWDDILKAIKALDGKRRTLVTLRGASSTEMVIGGGSDGRYIGYVAISDDSFQYLTSEHKDGPRVSLLIGGQEGDYPIDQVVTQTVVVTAAKTFSEIGSLDPQLMWKAA
jgi:hypothetical protein